MTTSARLSRITRCPGVGDRIFIDDKGSMRPATVDFCEDDQRIEFTFDDDGTAWSLVAVLPDGFDPLIFMAA
jgi:hypothetical protein